MGPQTFSVAARALPDAAVRRGVAVVCAGLLLASAGAMDGIASSPPPWSIVPAPNATAPNGSLHGVSCSSSVACTAVGAYVNKAGKGASLAEAWNGVAWTIQATSNPAGAMAANLLGVSCLSAADCRAVGSFTTKAGLTMILAEAWNGSAWTIQPTPNPAGAISSDLSGISCATASFCVAVGTSSTGPSSGTLSEAWNGSVWTIQTTPNPGGATASSLSAVSCTSVTACTAVGSSYPPGESLAETWNGVAWSIQAMSSPITSLSGVSCVSAGKCIAVGSGGAETWDGTSWNIQTTPLPAGADSSSLSGVSCTSATACEAVGTAAFLSNTATLAEVWNGATWAVQASPNPTSTSNNSLSGIFCALASSCAAVGSPWAGNQISVTLAEAWNGAAWKIKPTRNPIGATSSGLLAVSCTTATACVAVGAGAVSGLSAPIAQMWNGSSWVMQSIPNPSLSSYNSLSGVSCISTTACVAVGADGASSLAEAWNGATWTIQPTPNSPDFTNTELLAVSCTSPTACTAVGSASSGGPRGTAAPVAEFWNGATWTLQTTPGPTGANESHFTGVSCAAANACIAVGWTNKPGGRALAEDWNGSAWTILTTPAPKGVYASALNGVSCTSATTCIAVGFGETINFVFTTLVEAWDGSSWKIQHSPNRSGSTDDSLSGVSCTSATACKAVGLSSPNQSLNATLAESWNGTAWTIERSTNPSGGNFTNLLSVSCASPTACDAVGRTNFGNGSVTLAELHS